MKRTLASLAGGLVLTAACTSQPAPAADLAAIRAVDSQMVAALNARELDKWLGFLTEDARMMPPSSPAVEGKTAIRRLMAGLLALPSFEVVHHLATVVVSRGGDLAYVLYAYELTTPGPKGTPVTEKGKDIAIFRKQPDGSWKLVVDMWSPDQPPS